MIVTGGADKSIMIFDVKTGQVLHEAKAHTAYVRSVDWCCNGDLIASGSSDKSVKLWAAPSLATSKQLLGHSSWVRFVRFSPKADRLVSGGGDRVIILWSVPEGQILQRLAWHEATLSTACWLRTPKNQAVPPLATADRDGHVNLWQHDRGMAGIMHMTIISIDKLPSSANNVHRYCILSVGRNRESIATQPRPGSSHDFTHESATHDMSIAVWDQYEVIRIQLFEKDEDGHRASLLGEHRLAHRDIILMEPEERLNYSFGLVNGENDMVEDENKVATHVRMRFRFEHTEHQANLTVDVEDAKNVKLDQPGPVNSLCKVGTEAGQEFFTKVVMNSAMPSWHSSFTLGIGPATKEITVSLLLLERSGEALELGSSQLKMERLLQKVCSQQEPLEGWYVMRSGLDQRSRGVVRLRFRHSEAKKRSTLYLSFPSLVSGVRSDKTTRFAPTNRIKALKWTLWSGRCRHCKRYEREHGIEGVCRPVEHGHEKKVGVTSMASSSDGRLIAWGTETGYIEIATSDTADIVGSWHAHFRDVASLDFSAGHQSPAF
jgi:WD40 repeat protein